MLAIPVCRFYLKMAFIWKPVASKALIVIVLRSLKYGCFNNRYLIEIVAEAICTIFLILFTCYPPIPRHLLMSSDTEGYRKATTKLYKNIFER